MNFQQAQIEALIIRAKAVEVEVIQMQAHDKHAEQCGLGVYDSGAYLACANELYSISNEIQTIARSGYL